MRFGRGQKQLNVLAGHGKEGKLSQKLHKYI